MCMHQWTDIETVEMSRIRGNNFDIVTRRLLFQCINCEQITYTEGSFREYKDDYKDIDAISEKGAPSRWGT